MWKLFHKSVVDELTWFDTDHPTDQLENMVGGDVHVNNMRMMLAF